MAAFTHHLFICTNERAADDPRGCCAGRGGLEVASAFKRAIHERGLKRIVRANKAGCLDQCAAGATLVVYPGGVWYGRVEVEDVEEIVEQHLIGGRPVERLVLPPEALTGIDPDAPPPPDEVSFSR
ncbi:MAG: (2Fe-2S) ferredoxin domain-containing protein [Planctomycetota bacterium]|jgi:(2Fe-2S) ferredoxin|nr:(2Fe-2S) ferredoxin domain-containing protein [Planctomycetota bacterium]